MVGLVSSWESELEKKLSGTSDLEYVGDDDDYTLCTWYNGYYLRRFHQVKGSRVARQNNCYVNRYISV